MVRARAEQDLSFAAQIPVVAPGSAGKREGPDRAVARACGVHRLVLGAGPAIESPLDGELHQLPPLPLG